MRIERARRRKPVRKKARARTNALHASGVRIRRLHLRYYSNVLSGNAAISAQLRAAWHISLRRQQGYAGFVARGHEHALAFDSAEDSWSKVHDVRKLPAYEFPRRLPFCDTGHDGSGTQLAEFHRTFDEFVGVRDRLRSDHGSDAYIELREVVV